MIRANRRQVLRRCAVGSAVALAGCTGGGDGSSGPVTVTGLDVNCTSVEAADNPPRGDLVVYPNLGNDIEINIDHGFQEGGVYLKENGEPVDGWNPKKAPGGRLSLDRADEVVIVVQEADGSCTRWKGIAADLDT